MSANEEKAKCKTVSIDTESNTNLRFGSCGKFLLRLGFDRHDSQEEMFPK